MSQQETEMVDEKKVCEQCGTEKEITQFRKVKNMYTEVHRMSMCSECYITNQKATQQKTEEYFQRLKEEREKHREEQERLEEQRQQEHQADLEKAMRDNPVLCNRCNQPRTDGSFFLSDGSVYYPRKVCQTCTDNNPHTIYRMKCPLIGLVRYIGITTQSLNKRLGQHMRDGYGVEYKQYWIGDLRAHSLKPLIECESEAPNERAAKIEELRHIYHYLQQGAPLVNYEATTPQLVLFLQTSTTNWLEASEEDIKSVGAHYDSMSRSFSLEWGRYRKPLWLHRNEMVYLIQNGKSRYLWLNERADVNEMRAIYEKDYPTIMAHNELPTDRKERESILAKATIVRLRAYTDAIATPLIEQDCTFLLSRNIPIQVDDYTKEPSTSGRLRAVDYPRQGKKRVKAYEHGKLILHPYSYSVPAERAVTT